MSTLPTLTLTAAFTGVGSTDLSGRIRNNQFSIQRGTSQPSLTGLVSDAGSFSATLNNRDRALDPTNAAGPYFGDLVPGVGMTLVATWNAVDYSIFTGMNTQWPQLYPSFKADQISQIVCADAIRMFARAQLVDIFPTQLTGARIAAIDDAFPEPSSIDDGTSTVPFFGNGQSSSSAWSLMADATNAEWGMLICTGDGTVVFHDRVGIFNGGFGTPVATFGDGVGEMKYHDPIVAYDDQQIVNDADLLFNQFGVKAHAEDLTSQGQPWGKLSWQQNFQLASGALARSFVHEVVRRYANPAVRIEQLVVKPQRDPANLWPIVLGTELGQMFTVKITPQGGGARISEDCYVRHIQHDYSNNDWTTTYALQSGSLNTVTALYDAAGNYDSGLLYSF